MKYREQLQKTREMCISLIDLEIATEVENMKYDLLNKTMSEEEFELCCALIEEAYIKSEDITINQLRRALSDILEREENENKSIEEIIKNTSRRALIEAACWYD